MAQPGLTVIASIAEALAGRRLLLVLDNCEHVLDAVAELVETVLARAATVRVLATSREGLQVASEQLWPVPSLAVTGGIGSAAVTLFVERAQIGQPGFALEDPRSPRRWRRSVGALMESRWPSSSRRRGWCR